MKNITVCQDCKDRHPVCHDSCERYRQQKEEREAELETVFKNSRNDGIMDSYKHAVMRKERKRMRAKNF